MSAEIAKNPMTPGPVPPARARLPQAPWADCACWLSREFLLLLGRVVLTPGQRLTAALTTGEQSHALPSRCLTYRKGRKAGSANEQLLLLRFPPPDTWTRSGSLEVCAGAETFKLDWSAIPGLTIELRTLLRERLARLRPETRAEVVQFLVAVLADDPFPADVAPLSRVLSLVREALRQRLPRLVVFPNQTHAAQVEAILSVDEKSFYFRGWVRDEESSLTRLTAVSPEGCRTELLGKVFRYPRPDLDGKPPGAPGFVGYFALAVPSHLSAGWIVEMCNAAGRVVEIKAPAVVSGDAVVRDTILGDLVHDPVPRQELIRHHVFPAVNRLLEQYRETVTVAGVTQFGTRPNATVSIIIPLYRRVDFLEAQLAQFVRDPALRQADVIYVLDSPELTERFLATAEHLFRLYRIPFRVVALKRNGGFALANNIGASHATGRLLLLLNSDVLPDRPGWVEALTAFYDATPRIGALGPKLLYEDDSLQHAGLYFQRMAGSGLWNNEHYFKGLHRHLPIANVARPVPAVTAACLMIDRNLYQDLGGLRGIYAQGDYEDSDLCLRLMETGRENWYLPQVELYHLEGQSYPQPLRQLTGRYNCWLHTHLWDRVIEAVMARQAFPHLSFPIPGQG